MEVVLSILMLMLPLISIFRVNILPPFAYLLIGAHPYATAFAVLGSLFFRADFVVRKNNPIILFALLCLYLGYSTILGVKLRNMTFVSELVQVLICFGLAYFIYHFVDSYIRFQNLLKHLMFSGGILAALEIIITSLNLQIDTSAYLGIAAENYTAFYLVATTIAIPLAQLRSFILKVSLLSLGITAIYLNESRAMLLLSFLLIGFYLFYFASIKTKIVLMGLFVLLLLVAVSQFDTAMIYDSNSVFSVLNFENNFSNLERLSLLIYSYELFVNEPFGHGLGSSFALFNNNPYTINVFYPHPHNTIAFLAVELGIVGLIIYLLLIGGVFYTAFKCKVKHLKLLCLNISFVLLLGTIVEALFYNGLLMLSTFLLLSIALLCRKFTDNV